MRGLVGRLNHRDAVLSNLNALLLLYPPKRQFSDDFPKLKSVVRSHFDDGISAPLSALQIAETIIENFIQQLTDTEKAAALDGLISTGRKGFAVIAEKHVQRNREPQPTDNVTFVTRLTGVAIFMADHLAQEGALSRSDHQGFVERLAAAFGANGTQIQALNDSFGSS
jgi:hypothetical protein